MSEDERRDKEREEAFQRRQDRRRERLRQAYDTSRKRRQTESPPDLEGWEPRPWWKHSLEMLWDNPLALLFVAIAIAIVLYVLFPPAQALFF